jgi:hypothetical protein
MKLLINLCIAAWIMIEPVIIQLFPDAFAPDYLVLTYTRGWIHCSKLKKDEAIHGICMSYISLS